MNESSRYSFAYPKIGIRPVIDGRRQGIRESLEEQTMDMAKRAKELISSTLRYPNGKPVEVVLADTTIGGVYEAALCQEKFASQNVAVTLTVTPCWCYGTETMDMDPLTIKAVWGLNATERPGAVYLASAMSAYAQKGLPAFSIYGRDVQDADDGQIPEDVKEKILLFARCALACALMRGKSYLQIGSMCMGIAGSILNQDFMQNYLGMRSESVDESEILRRIQLGIYDHEELDRALAFIRKNCPEGFDKNPPEKKLSDEEKQKHWAFVAKCTLIIRDLMIGNPVLAEMGFVEESCGHNAVVAGVQGQRQWTDFQPNFDFAEAMLCSQFDWNGLREAFVLATENDTLNAVTMLFEHLLSGGSSVFADVRTFWSPEAVLRVTGHRLEGEAKNGIIHLINSGAAALDGSGAMSDEKGNPVMKPFYEMDWEDAKACLEATDWCPADRFYFRGGGFSSHFKRGTRGGMPVTLARLNLVKGLGPCLQIAEGWSCSLPEDVHRTLEMRTDPTWPTTWFAPRLTGVGAFQDVYHVMASWGANHGAFCYGHIGDRLITMASMLRIPVSLHNVEKERIYRPHCFASFGTQDLEGADFRACQAYGPLY